MDEEPHKRETQREQQQKQEAEQYDSFLYKFQQQIIDAWKPVPYTSNNVILYSILSFVCVGLGLALILTAPTTLEYEKRYDNQGGSITIQVTSDLESPSFLYYGFTNFYQNHRQFLKFFSATQLEDGQQIDATTAQDECGSSMHTNAQLGFSTSPTGAALAGDDVGFPCGPRAKSYYELRPELQSFSLSDSNGNNIALKRSDIAWPHDVGLHQNWDVQKQGFDVTEEDWLIWFRPAAKKDFFKLYARIETALEAGNYTFSFTESYDTSAFGQKWIHLSNSNYVGNKDLFLGIAFLSLGGGCVILLIIFIAKCVTERRDRPKAD